MALTQPAIIPQPWGSDGQVGSIPQDSSEFGKASWAKGFPAETAQPLTEGGIPPSYLDFQGVLNILSAHAVFQQAGAHYSWSNTLDYPVGCFVLGSDGKLYQALQASGPGYSAGAKNPTANSQYWSVVPLASEIVALEQKDAVQDAAIQQAQSSADAAQSSADEKVASVNGLTPDSNGNVDVGGMPLGTLIPYTGKDVPAGTLRADGTTYTNMQASFPEFYAWVVASGLTVPIADYALVEGSCGFYGIDTSTGTVRMPTLAAGVFGTVAGQYGEAVAAGLPNIKGTFRTRNIEGNSHFVINTSGPFYNEEGTALGSYVEITGTSTPTTWTHFDASLSSPVYGNSNTVTPSHVKYPWVIVVYNAAVPPSVAQAGEFVELLAGKAGVNAENFTAEGKALLARLGMPGESSIELDFGASGASYSIEDADGWLFVFINTTNSAGAKLDMYYTEGVAGISTMRGNAGIIRAFLPLRKGSACTISYKNVSQKHLYFVPVVGAE